MPEDDLGDLGGLCGEDAERVVPEPGRADESIIGNKYHYFDV